MEILGTLRLLVIIFSVSTWHWYINEFISSGELEANSCRLFKYPSFLIVLLLHFILICIFFYINRGLNYLVASINILFGAFIVMSLKPPQWFFSFEWEDCYSLYNNDNAIGRTAMFSYVLITAGAVELIEVVNEWSKFQRSTSTKICVLLCFTVFLFIACWGMWGLCSAL